MSWSVLCWSPIQFALSPSKLCPNEGISHDKAPQWQRRTIAGSKPLGCRNSHNVQLYIHVLLLRLPLWTPRVGNSNKYKWHFMIYNLLYLSRQDNYDCKIFCIYSLLFFSLVIIKIRFHSLRSYVWTHMTRIDDGHAACRIDRSGGREQSTIQKASHNREH